MIGYKNEKRKWLKVEKTTKTTKTKHRNLNYINIYARWQTNTKNLHLVSNAISKSQKTFPKLFLWEWSASEDVTK